MAKIKLNETVTINGIEYSAGDILNVSSSIYSDLVEVRKCAKPFLEESSTTDTKKSKK